MAFPDSMMQLLGQHYALLLLSFWVLCLLRNRYLTGLTSIPGSFLASLSDIYLLVDVLRGETHIRLLDGHKKHKSKFIRIGPKKISISDSSLVPKIYGFEPLLKKSDLVHIFRTPCNGQFVPSLFNTSDEAYHSRIKKPFGNAYSMSTLVEFEDKVDTTTKLLEKCLDGFAESGRGFDLPWWLQAYAFDVLGEICFSRKLGFLESGKDVQGIIADVKQKVWTSIVMVQARVVGKTLIGLAARLAPTHPIVEFCLKCLEERKRLNEKNDCAETGEKRDFLARCFAAQAKYPGVVDDDLIRTVNVDNIMAGSDTTAITLSAIIYHLMLNAQCLRKLRAEIDELRASDPVTWKEASRMPYLQACIKEGLRIHPVLALPLERVIPAGGLTLSGVFLPAGTIVGCSPYIVARDEKVFPDPNVFKPERWLGEDLEQLAIMEKSLLAFGGGKRICIGKNIAMLEMSKLIPQVVRRYELAFEGGVDRMSAPRSWFTWMKDFRVVIKKRYVIHDHKE